MFIPKEPLYKNIHTDLRKCLFERYNYETENYKISIHVFWKMQLIQRQEQQMG